ncbi:MAG: hypothetical protein JOZ15_19620, partial [Acidobacteria bacterium]|nr:hypothetical protein [Acidobacteriota bacterium]
MTDGRSPAIQGFLRSEVARLAGFDPGRIDESRPLTACGLDSLAMVELQAAVENELGVELSVADLLAGITLRELAERLAGAAAAAGSQRLPAAAEPEPVPAPAAAAEPAAAAAPFQALSPGQRALWAAHQMAPESPAYTLAAAARLLSYPGAKWLRGALQSLLDRHAALRTTFGDGPDGPLARVVPHADLTF